MAKNEIHVGDIGTAFVVTVKNDDDSIVNMALASVKEFHFMKPDGSVLIKDASFVTDGMDGKIKYVTEDGDLDQNGTWRYQIYAVFGPSSNWSDISKFRVYPNVPL